MTRVLIDDLNKILFLLRSHSLTKAATYVEKAVAILSKTPNEVSDSRLQGDYHKTLSSLRETVSSLRKCASTSRPDNPGLYADIAKETYRQSLILYLVATGEIYMIRKAGRYAYTALATGLPTGALFGLSPLAAALIFMGALWTYFYFARLRLIGWIVIVSSLVLLLPFLVNASIYFAGALIDPNEISSISNELGVDYSVALVAVIVLFAISTISLLASLLALRLLFKYRAVFK